MYDTSLSADDQWKYDPNYLKMADFLGLQDMDRHDYDVAKKIAFLRDFTEAKEEVDAKIKLKEIIADLGVQSKGKELVKHLYEYARLYQDKTRIDKEMSLYREKPEEPPKTEQPKQEESTPEQDPSPPIQEQIYDQP